MLKCLLKGDGDEEESRTSLGHKKTHGRRSAHIQETQLGGSYGL